MDLVCFCHIRWEFVFQRPQHLLTRFAKYQRVFFIEEPIFKKIEKNYLQINKAGEQLWIVTPLLIEESGVDDAIFHQKILLKNLYRDFSINHYSHWYYTPMALTISSHLQPEMVIYDCMDELSNFKFAPVDLKQKEKDLFRLADLVFTGGHNLYQAKKDAHHNIFAFPSSIDKQHFMRARKRCIEPYDHANIPRLRFGFYGVIDERFDVELIRKVATRRPNWHFILIGPVIKIDPSILPRLENIHYLGSKQYEELPAYLSGWDIAMIPFLLNDSTKYISPTKTPEYLAAGVPVISTSIVDVVNPYALNELVHIADNADAFIEAAEKELSITDKSRWLQNVDLFLKENSWDETWRQMVNHINKTLHNKKTTTITIKKEGIYV